MEVFAAEVFIAEVFIVEVFTAGAFAAEVFTVGAFVVAVLAALTVSALLLFKNFRKNFMKRCVPANLAGASLYSLIYWTKNRT